MKTKKLILCFFLLSPFFCFSSEKDLTAEIKKQKKEIIELEKKTEEAKKKLIEKLKEWKEVKKKSQPEITELQFYIPRLKKPPKIDGIIDEEEWKDAILIPITAGIYGMMERPSSVFYIGWDPENFYVAQRLPMRKGEKPLRLNREPKHDNVYCGETSVEVWIDRGGTGSTGHRSRYQFMGNASGNKWDREDQFEIGQNNIMWDGEWEYKQQLTPDGKYWEAEIAIPRKTVYQPEPIKDGDIWYLGLATNLHRPWTFSGFYRWNICGIFKEKIPVIRMFHPERSLKGKKIVFDMYIKNTTDKKFEGEVIGVLADGKNKKKIIFEKKEKISLQPGEDIKIKFDEEVTNAKDKYPYRITIMVVSEGKSYYTWAYPIKYNDPNNKYGLNYVPEKAPFILKTFYNPLRNYLRVVVDKYDVPEKEKIKRALCYVMNSKNEKVAEGKIKKFPYEKGQTTIGLPVLKSGKYLCKVELVDEKKNVKYSHSVSFEVKDLKKFPWLNNKIGEEDVLLKPFKPLKVRGDTIYGYEKEIKLSGLALPSYVKAARIELFSSPVRICGKSNGEDFEIKPLRKKPYKIRVSKTKVEYRGKGKGGPLRIETDYLLEYDGTAKIKIKLKPKGEKAEIEELKIIIPFKKEAATHMMTVGLDFRGSCKAGLIPEGEGVVWSSKEVPYQKMTIGSFVPIVHIGNLNSGITWFASNDKGWWPSDKKAAIEIVRKGKEVLLVLNIASEKVEFSKEREIIFGLCTVPTRPVSEYKRPSVVVSFGASIESGRWDPKKTQNRNEAAHRVYPDDIEKFKKFAAAHHRYNEIIIPYTEQNQTNVWKHEYEYFKEEWRQTEDGGFIFCESSNDCMIYWTEKWIKEGEIDGYYLDNVCARINWNTHSGNAYYLPDGRIQPGFDLWKLRDYVKRLRTIFQKYRDPAMICIHNTRFQFAPIMAFADLAMGGEMPTPWPGGPDFMDMYPRDFMDVMYNPYLWGYKISHLYHFRWKNFKDVLGNYDREKAMKGHRTAMATMLVHGVEFFQGIEYKSFLMNKFKLLKKLPGKFEFIPSWKANGLFKVVGNGQDIDVAVYKKEDVLLIIATNYSKKKKKAKIWVDFPKLINLPDKMERRVIVDFETFEFPGYVIPKPDTPKAWRCGGISHNTMHIPNTMIFDIEPRDFRAFLLINLPEAKGAGF